MNAEIVARLQESFDIPDQAGAIVQDVSSEVASEIDEAVLTIKKSLDDMREEIRTVLARVEGQTVTKSDAAQPKDDGEQK